MNEKRTMKATVGKLASGMHVLQVTTSEMENALRDFEDGDEVILLIEKDKPDATNCTPEYGAAHSNLVPPMKR